MTAARRIGAKILVSASFLSPMALAGSLAPANDSATHATVVVIRGSHGNSEFRLPGVAKSAQPAESVIVMRPAPGSFMRETTRLAAEADAREERAAMNAARQANNQLMETLKAVESAAGAAETQWNWMPYQVFVQTRGGVVVNPSRKRMHGGSHAAAHVPIRDPR